MQQDFYRRWNDGPLGQKRHKKGFRIAPEALRRGAEGIRTLDPLHAMEMRYQLRHSPVDRK